jgi:hypothetical protein
MPPTTTANGWVKTLESDHSDVLATYHHAGKHVHYTRTVYLSSCLPPGAFLPSSAAPKQEEQSQPLTRPQKLA